MSKLFKYLKPYAASIAAIVAILIVQAFCDLSLPAYTSDIVNVGIQQGGIDDKIPQALREEDMDKLLLFMSEEDAAVVKQAYELKSTDTGYDYDGAVYVLDSSKKEDEETVDKLVEIMGKPMLLTSGFESDSDMTKQMEDSMKENMKSAMEQQAQAQMEAAQSQMTRRQCLRQIRRRHRSSRKKRRQKSTLN